MDITMLIRLLTWCTLINGAVLLFWTLFLVCAPDLVYRTQRRWFALSRSTCMAVIYALVGLYKMLFLFFNVVPLCALLIIF